MQKVLSRCCALAGKAAEALSEVEGAFALIFLLHTPSVVEGGIKAKSGKQTTIDD